MATEQQKRSPKIRLEPDGAALMAPLDAVQPGKNARSAWEVVDDRLVQLAESIQEQGILEPLLVREIHGGGGRASIAGRRFELIAGFRRFAAARHLALDRVPVRLLRASDEDALALNLAENLARADLSDSDALQSVVRLQETYGWGVRKVARATGRSASWVSEILAVARSRAEREAVESGRLAIGGAARLARLKGEFSDVRDALLERLDSGEQVMIEEVPRLSELRQRTRTDTKESARPGNEPPPAPGASRQPGLRQPLTLSRQDQSLMRNAGTLMHQALTALYAAWTDQGFGHTLPDEVREGLRRTAGEIEALLARERTG